MLPIIDTHQHLWDLSRLNLPWLAGAPAINRSFLTADYLAATAGANVVKSIYMEVDVEPSQRVAEAEQIIAICEQEDTPTCGAVISGSPASPDFKTYIDRFKDNPYIKGIRQVLHVRETRPGLCLENDYVAGVRYLGEVGLSFDLCMRPSEILDGAKLADRCPDTRFILDHCGNADPKLIRSSESQNRSDPFWHDAADWRDDISALAERENIVCKISGIVARATPGSWTAADLAPTINHCLDAFGPDRVIFGGDWPVCTVVASYQEWAAALREVIANRSEEDQRKLLHDNAVRIYNLS